MNRNKGFKLVNETAYLQRQVQELRDELSYISLKRKMEVKQETNISCDKKQSHIFELEIKRFESSLSITNNSLAEARSEIKEQYEKYCQLLLMYERSSVELQKSKQAFYDLQKTISHHTKADTIQLTLSDNLPLSLAPPIIVTESRDTASQTIDVAYSPVSTQTDSLTVGEDTCVERSIMISIGTSTCMISSEVGVQTDVDPNCQIIDNETHRSETIAQKPQNPIFDSLLTKNLIDDTMEMMNKKLESYVVMYIICDLILTA